MSGNWLQKMWSESNYRIPVFQNIFLPISSFSSCNTSEIIYFILCTKFKTFYIRKSKRTVKTRISELLYSIKKCVPFSKNFTSASTHFNLKEHSLRDFKFFILDSDKEHLNILDLEKKLIHLIKSKEFNFLNWDYPSDYNNIYSINVCSIYFIFFWFINL